MRHFVIITVLLGTVVFWDGQSWQSDIRHAKWHTPRPQADVVDIMRTIPGSCAWVSSHHLPTVLG